MSKETYDKIRGAFYGYVIGDAMGATTELMHPFEIRREYGLVDDIIGGGWMGIKPGNVTGNTQMMLAVMRGMRHARRYDSLRSWFLLKGYVLQELIEMCEYEPQFVDWRSKLSIEKQSDGKELEHDKNVLQSGSLLRALPLAIMGPDFLLSNMGQGKLTHNNNKCTRAIIEYHNLICNLIYNSDYEVRPKDIINCVHVPSGELLNVWANGLYWSQKESFERSIIGPVNHGGISPSIAAISGSIAGAKCGYKQIPQRWIRKLNNDIKCNIELFIRMALRYVQSKGNVIE